MKADGTWSNVTSVHVKSNFQRFKTHSSMIFLPWHRKFFVEVENRLQMALDDCSATIPSWNWALELPTFETANIWSANRLGSLNTGIDTKSSDVDEMCVKDGLFGSETSSSNFGKGVNEFRTGLTRLNQGRGSDCIMRAGKAPGGLNYATIKATLQEDFKGHNAFEQMSTYLENEIHNHIHVDIGGRITPADSKVRSADGHMTSMFSPYDPVFFLHHGFIDNLWKQWQDTHLDETERMHRSHDMMNHLLFDGLEDRQYPVSDVAMSLDIIDDNPDTPETEKACVYYHERKLVDHRCADIWNSVQECLRKVVAAKRLHEVPRIRELTSVGDVCSPLNPVKADEDRIWLETLAAMGMMDKDEVPKILKWERTLDKEINGIIPTLDEADASECDKAVCFSTTKLLEICGQL
jgi:hypothetical protein